MVQIQQAFSPQVLIDVVRLCSEKLNSSREANSPCSACPRVARASEPKRALDKSYGVVVETFVLVMDEMTLLTCCMGRIFTCNLFCISITLEKAFLGLWPEVCVSYQFNGFIPVLLR